MEEKVKFEIEFPIQASPSLLYQYMSSPSGMSEWFADNVKLLGKKSDERIKFRWMDDVEDENLYFFELRIVVDEITKDVSLIVTDFAEEDEIDEGKMFWENQIAELKHIIGSN